MRKRERGKKTTALTRTVKRMLETSSFSRRTFARHVAAGCREHAKWPSWLVGSVKAPVCTSPGRTMAVRDVEGDSRRVRIFAKYVREKCHGRLPRVKDRAELAGWEREDADIAQVRVGSWWNSFSIMNDGARKKRVEESAPDEETQQALRDLAQCEKRNVGYRDVEGDPRRVRIFAKYVHEECHSRLPRKNDLAELAGWEREGAGVARVPVGQWWSNFSIMNDGARKKRVEESARDEATQKALRDLAQCDKRDSKRFKRQQT